MIGGWRDLTTREKTGAAIISVALFLALLMAACAFSIGVAGLLTQWPPRG